MKFLVFASCSIKHMHLYCEDDFPRGNSAPTIKDKDFVLRRASRRTNSLYFIGGGDSPRGERVP